MLFQERKIHSVWVNYLKETFFKFDDEFPRHNTINSKIQRPDFVVIKLKEPFELNDYVKPACKPTKPIETSSSCYISGWGVSSPMTIEEMRNKTFPRQHPDKLLAVKLQVLSSDDCEKAHRKFTGFPFLKEYEICLESSNKDACSGDSGGPLICEGK